MPCRAPTLDPLPTRGSAENNSHCQSWDQCPVPVSLWHQSHPDPQPAPAVPPPHQHLLQSSLNPTLWWWLLPQLPAAPTAARDAALPTALLSPTKACQIHSGTVPQGSPRTTKVFLCWSSHGTSLSDSMVTQTWVGHPLLRELRPLNQTTDTHEPPKGPNLVPLSDQLLSQLLSPGH